MSLDPGSFATIAACLRAGSGLAIGADKDYLLEGRLAPVLRRHALADLARLAERLRAPGSGALASEVVEAMTTNESFFFRDARAFAQLADVVLPRLCAARPAGSRLRLWSAAAATGQEAYSAALVIDAAADRLAGRPVEILGTDIARGALARARAGSYTQFEVQRGLPPELLRRHFAPQGPSWRLSAAIRDRVDFRPWNLLHDLAPLGLFDVIFCRNVLIYFDLPTKRRVLDAIAERLQPDGALFLGGAETTLGLTGRLVPVPGEPGLYARAEAVAAGAAACQGVAAG